MDRRFNKSGSKRSTRKGKTMTEMRSEILLGMDCGTTASYISGEESWK